MFENIAAIDIGTSSVKVMTVRTGIKDFQVKSLVYEDIIADTQETSDPVNNTLSRILEELSQEDYIILTNLPLEKTIIRDLKFPFNDVEKMSEAIPYEAEENIPYSLEEVILDFLPVTVKGRDEGRVLLTAAHKDTINDCLEPFRNLDISPIRMGLESQALFECYRYFNTIEDETVVQLHIGNSKTIINIIQNNRLLFTRSISAGVSSIHRIISDVKGVSNLDAVQIFEKLHLDLATYNNNLQTGHYKSVDLKKNELKEIHKKSLQIIDEINEQILLTIKAFNLSFGNMEFNRVLISGGGANIVGIGSLISKDIDLPVSSLPFLEEYKEVKLQTQFPVVFGIILSYLNRKGTAVNFLKGEFLPDAINGSWKKYYLAGGFVTITIIVLIINLLLTSYLKSESNKKYNDILNERLKRYFHTREVSEDPVKDALKILNDEKKEFDNINTLIRTEERVLDVLKDLLSLFPKDETFELKSMLIKESVIRIDGSVESSKNIDEFKNKLIESKKFDSVTLNTNLKKGRVVRFSMTINLKQTELEKKAKKKVKK